MQGVHDEQEYRFWRDRGGISLLSGIRANTSGAGESNSSGGGDDEPKRRHSKGNDRDDGRSLHFHPLR